MERSGPSHTGAAQLTHQAAHVEEAQCIQVLRGGEVQLPLEARHLRFELAQFVLHWRDSLCHQGLEYAEDNFIAEVVLEHRFERVHLRCARGNFDS